ncbi:hypothetical protein SSCG_04345 [Streptomyces clavuligerus]|nr:hypothetical protein SSCG_04345 [Streptomyces clavuligerus]
MPDPVGATTRTSEPSPIARQAPDWAAVGAANAPVNQLRVAGEKESSAFLAMNPIVHPATDNRPCPAGRLPRRGAGTPPSVTVTRRDVSRPGRCPGSGAGAVPPHRQWHGPCPRTAHNG